MARIPLATGDHKGCVRSDSPYRSQSINRMNLPLLELFPADAEEQRRSLGYAKAGPGSGPP